MQWITLNVSIALTLAKLYKFPSTLPITNKSKVFQADMIHNNVFQLL